MASYRQSIVHVNLLTLVAVAFGSCVPITGWAADGKRASHSTERLLDFNIEELMNVEVTSVARKKQKLSEAAAAIHVITQQDIRRSGMTTIPELLRMVPGMNVAQIDASKWAVSSRGFNERFANKLLVLVDGREIYSPVFGGVRWNMNNLLLADVERIEVIRGPGGALWGANAVNGVINVITKHARDSQGGLIQTSSGDQEKGLGTVRYGSEIKDNSWLRVYAKYFNHGNFTNGNGLGANDQWNEKRVGFRVDWQGDRSDSVMLAGEAFRGDADQTTVGAAVTSAPSPGSVELEGWHLQARWSNEESDTSNWILQSYFEHSERNELVLGRSLDILNVEFQHRFKPLSHHELNWGLGYRLIKDDFANSIDISFTPERSDTELFSFFMQDEIALYEDLHLIVGSKFEHNDYTGFEYQPNVRLLWQAAPRHTIWGAISKAVRSPARSDDSMRINIATIPGMPSKMISLLGDSDFESETLLAWELGYRGQLSSRFSLDVAAFYNQYDNLQTVEPGLPRLESTGASPHLLFPMIFDNRMEGESYGIEAIFRWSLTDRWKLTAGYSWLTIALHTDPDSRDISSEEKAEGRSPKHQFQLQSSVDLSENLALDTSLYYVDQLPSSDIASYTRLDLRLSWQLRPGLEFSLVAQNLLDEHHSEFIAEDVIASEVQRGIYAKFSWRW